MWDKKIILHIMSLKKMAIHPLILTLVEVQQLIASIQEFMLSPLLGHLTTHAVYGCNEVITDNNNLHSVVHDQDLEPLGSPEHKFDNSIYGTETDTYSQETRSIFPPSRPPVIYDTIADEGHCEPVNFKRIENSGAIVTELKADSEHVYSCID